MSNRSWDYDNIILKINDKNTGPWERILIYIQFLQSENLRLGGVLHYLVKNKLIKGVDKE